MKLDKFISNCKLLKILLVVFSLTVFNTYSCVEVSLDYIKGSKTKDFLKIEFEIKNAKVVIHDKTLNISADDATKINTSMQDFVENGLQSIHYGMLVNCSPEIEDSKENSPIILSFKNPVTNSDYFLELGFLPSEPNSVKPRENIVKSINDKCGPIKGAIKEDLLVLKDKISKAASSSKAQLQEKIKKNKEEDNAATKGGDKQEVESLKTKLAELSKKLDQLKKDHNEHSQKSAESQKNRMSSASETKAMTDDQKTTKAKILEIQKKIEEKNKTKQELQGKKPKSKEEDKATDKSAADAIRDKSEEKQKTLTKLDLTNQDVADSSKEAQKLQSKVSQAEYESKSADQELEKLDNSTTEDEKLKAESDARNAKEKYNSNKKNLEKTKKTHEQKEVEYKNLIKQKEDFLKSNELKLYEKIRRREDENKKTMKVLDDLEKCFTFREGFIAQLKTSFSNHSMDSINMIMSIKPNKHNYNFVDNIFSSKVPNVCNEIQTAKRKLRKLEKRKLRKDAETEEERKLREQGKTKRNGLIYSSLEEGRLDRVLEYNADKNEFIN